MEEKLFSVVAVHESFTQNVQVIHALKSRVCHSFIVHNIIVPSVRVTQRIVGGCCFVVRLVRMHSGRHPHRGSGGVDCSEDCLPAEGEIEGLGASLPELEILGYPETKQGYYIRCPDCVARFAGPKDEDDRLWVEAWKKELALAQKKWERGELETEEEVVEPERKKIKMQVSKSTPSPKKDWFKLSNFVSPVKPKDGILSPKKGFSMVGNQNQYPRIANPAVAKSSPKKVVASSIFSPKKMPLGPKTGMSFAGNTTQHPRISNPKIVKTSPKKTVAGSSKDASPSTITTEEEEFVDDDVYEVVQELRVGKAREVIIID
jgi:hypothetical protein